LAAHHELKEIVEMLTAEGTNVNTINLDGNTPFGWALVNKRTELADLLRNHGGKTNKEL